MNRMNASIWAAAIVVATSLVACDKKGDSAGPAGSASTTTAAATTARPKTTRKLADIKAAYAAELEDMKKMNDPMDKRVNAFLAKVGKADSEDGNKKVWYALDGDKCSKVELNTKTGAMTEETTSKSDCGM